MAAPSSGTFSRPSTVTRKSIRSGFVTYSAIQYPIAPHATVRGGACPVVGALVGKHLGLHGPCSRGRVGGRTGRPTRSHVTPPGPRRIRATPSAELGQSPPEVADGLADPLLVLDEGEADVPVARRGRSRRRARSPPRPRSPSTWRTRASPSPGRARGWAPRRTSSLGRHHRPADAVQPVAQARRVGPGRSG